MSPLTEVLNTGHISSFETDRGCEVFITFESPRGLDFTQSLRQLFRDYDEFCTAHDLSAQTEIHIHCYLSDISNQAAQVRALMEKRHAFALLVGQPPVSGAKIALRAYHIRSVEETGKKLHSPHMLSVHHGGYQSLWTSHRPASPDTSEVQTGELFKQLCGVLGGVGGVLSADVVRTWIYVRDVDNNYKGMVASRRALFKKAGLTEKTHYIASTGIQGCGEIPTDLVTMHALTVLGLEPGQIEFMQALDFLSPTYVYNVTFERATRLLFGDRSHYHISGTASIDKKGKTVFVGDVIRQADRTLINVDALLSRYESSLQDLKYLVVYLRDPADAPVIRDFLIANLPHTVLYTMVLGAVCRPEWLVEVDGLAINDKGNPAFASFC